MRFLHTADWHLGQLFHEYERTYEHEQFLKWLLDTLKSEKIDVLLHSGDIFDHSNPSAASVKMFYSFLSTVIKTCPDIQIVVIAGNHDSAARLETPKPLLESSNVHIVGLIERDKNGEIDYDKMIVPLKDSTGEISVLCLAVPFLRLGDYPAVIGAKSPYTEGVAAFYKAFYERAEQIKVKGQSVIAMGHLHALNSDVSDLDDDTERAIMGGVEGIAPNAFHEDIKYVALGHIHKAQSIGGRESVRYSGSPIPLSFSEHNYQHQVVVFDIINENLQDLRAVDVPVSIPLQRIPEFHKPLEAVLAELRTMPVYEGEPHLAPYLLVRVLLSGPEPALRHKIDKALEGKNARFLKIDTKQEEQAENEQDDPFMGIEKLKELSPMDLFLRTYKKSNYTEDPKELVKLLNEVLLELSVNN
jgi:exonuclease SbcD